MPLIPMAVQAGLDRGLGDMPNPPPMAMFAYLGEARETEVPVEAVDLGCGAARSALFRVPRDRLVGLC